MPNFRKLSAEEVTALSARRRGSVDLAEYREFIRDIPAGEGGEIVLGEGELKRTIKRRIAHAAQQQQREVRFRRTEGNVIRFEIS